MAALQFVKNIFSGQDAAQVLQAELEAKKRAESENNAHKVDQAATDSLIAELLQKGHATTGEQIEVKSKQNLVV
jgi:hypothetical protein